ncbi:unnamed protein product [Meloidogyne enterolobii]|uniref:Uncharacterized protein n=1 Tax=Meloidogyne enterolobii TaxID=390850 RepID=A0ACB0YA15_MELEN
MAPEKRNQASLFRSWIKNYPDSIFTTDSKIIFCNACSQQVPATKSFHLRQHSETAKHQSNLKRYGSEQQQLISSSFSRSETSDTFLEELCDSFLAANIPLWKLTNEVLREFLSKYCKRIIPDESTLRKKYVDICYQKAMARIRVEVGSGYVWASVDESTDCQGRYVANLLVGMLHSSEFHVPSLVAVKMLEATNHSTVARFVNDGLSM